MRVTFLGVWMTPDVGETVSLVVEAASGDRLLIDCGTNLVGSLKRNGIAPESISYLFVTHHHGDHISGLPTYLFYRYVIQKNVYQIDPGILTIIGSDETLNAIHEYVRIANGALADNPNIHYQTISAGHELCIGSSQLTPFDTIHQPPTLGFVFKEDAKKLVYSADTALSDSVMQNAYEADLLIHDVVGEAAGNGPLAMAHTLCSDLSHAISDRKVKSLAPVHRLSLYVDEERLSCYESELASEYSGKVIIPFDGTVLDI